MERRLNGSEESGGELLARPVFISYRRADRQAADRLYELLEKRGVGAWYDPLISPTEDWREAIVQAIREATVVVILLSAEALESEELRKELAVAASSQVPLLPVRLENVVPVGAFAYELDRRQWFDAFPDTDARLAELADFLKVLVETPKEIPSRIERFLRRYGNPRKLARMARNNTALVILFVAVSCCLFVVYDQAVAPREVLAVTHGSLTAFLFVLIAVTIASPFLLFQAAVQDGLGALKPALIVGAAVNTWLLILLARNLGSWVWQRFRSSGK